MFSFDGMRSLLDTGGKERVFEEEEEEEVEEEVLFKAAMNEVDAGRERGTSTSGGAGFECVLNVEFVLYKSW